MKACFPLLLDKSTMQPVRALRPEKVQLSLRLRTLSRAVMTLKGEEAVLRCGDFVRIFSPCGDAGVYRVEQTEEEYTCDGLTQRVTLLHALVTLRDCLIWGKQTFTGNTPITVFPSAGVVRLSPGETAYIYRSASVSSGKVVQVANGTVLTVRYPVETWYAVEYGGYAGYMPQSRVYAPGEDFDTGGSVIAQLLHTAQGENERWMMGQYAPTRLRGYEFENENLMSAVTAIVNENRAQVMLTFDMASYPWTMHLVHPPEETHLTLRTGHMTDRLTVTRSLSTVCTRLYALGKDGITMAPANSGVPYVQSAGGEWGLISRVIRDERITDSASLRAMAENRLSQLENPETLVEGELTGLCAEEEASRLYPGALVSVPSGGEMLMERILQVDFDDVTAATPRISLRLGSGVRELGTLLTEERVIG